MKTILVLSDEPVFAAGLRYIIAGAEGFAVSAVCPNHKLMIDEIQRSGCPDLLLVGIASSITLGVCAQLQSMAATTALILRIEDVMPEFASQALQLGVRAFLPRSAELEDYMACFRTVAVGGLWMPKNLTAQLLSVIETILTPRELQLTTLLMQGLKNKQIAWEMGLTEGTVKVYFSHLFLKVGANDRFELALLVLKNLTPAQTPDLWNFESHDRQSAKPFALSRFCRPLA
jgi:DNA-binding NarL/FixJ family response regulator